MAQRPPISHPVFLALFAVAGGNGQFGYLSLSLPCVGEIMGASQRRKGRKPTLTPTVTTQGDGTLGTHPAQGQNSKSPKAALGSLAGARFGQRGREEEETPIIRA